MVLTALVECKSCSVTFEGTWADDSDTIEDMDESPTEWQLCPACGIPQEETYPGWCTRTEAG